MPTPKGNGQDKSNEILAVLHQLQKALDPVVTQIRRTQPLITSRTAKSPSFDTWSSGWQADAEAAIRCMVHTLPEELYAAARAARNTG